MGYSPGAVRGAVSHIRRRRVRPDWEGCDAAAKGDEEETRIQQERLGHDGSLLYEI